MDIVFNKIMQMTEGLFPHIENLKNLILSEILAQSKPREGNKLYHYTSEETLYAMLESNNIRATEFNYLNDAEEVVYGGKLLHEHIVSLHSNTNQQFISQLLLHYSNNLIYHHQEFRRLMPTFVASFSSTSDSLSQWRAYGDSAKGVQIEFDFNDCVVATQSGNSIQILDILPVVYERDLQNHVIEKAINYCNETFSQLLIELSNLIEVDPNISGVLQGLISHAFEPIELLFKHPSFYEEHEYRAVVVCQKPSIEPFMKVAQSYTGEKKYIEAMCLQDMGDKYCQLESLPITDIIVGPLSDSLENIRKHMEQRNFTSVEQYKKSSIPLKY